MSVICQNFVQNAWRKDLCSNCFKSEADHAVSGCRNSLDRLSTAGRYIPQAATLYQSRVIATNIHWRPLLADPGSKLQGRLSSRDFGGSQGSLLDENDQRQHPQLRSTKSDASKGILKESTPNKVSRRSSVGFSSDEPLVIGYGGNDYDSDESPWELGSDDGSINLELLDVTEEDRSITKLTKNNTEFNSLNENLVPSPPPNDSLKNSKNKDPVTPSNMNSKGVYTQSSVTSNYNRFDAEQKIKTNSSNGRRDDSSKIDTYYFNSTSSESMKTQQRSIHTNSNLLTEAINFADECKEMSIIAKDIPGILNNIQNNNVENRYRSGNLNDKNIEKSLNGISNKEVNAQSRTEIGNRYLLVTKVENSETGSDSDYSTSKQNVGESSTDTESFHDAEDMPMIPCSSFLHGKVDEQRSTADSRSVTSNSISKPFETSSVSSSSDMSTFSDDSDSHRYQEDSYHREKRHSSVREVGAHTNSGTPKSDSRLNQNDMKNDDKRKDKNGISQSNSTYKSVPLYIHKKSLSSGEENSRSGVSEKNIVNNGGKYNNYGVISLENGIGKGTTNRVKKTDCMNSTSVIEKSNHNEISHSEENAHSDEKYNQNQSTPSHSKCNIKNNIIIGKNTLTGRMSSYVTQELNQSQKLVGDCSGPMYSKTSVENAIGLENPSMRNGSGVTTDDENRKSISRECNGMISNTQEDNFSVKERNSQSSEEDQTNCEEILYQDSLESNSSSTRNSPNSMQNRQSKLAALALELEKARCDSMSMSSNEFKQSLSLPEAQEHPTVKQPIIQNSNKLKDSSSGKSKNPTSESSNGVTKIVCQNDAGKYPSIRRGRSLVSSSTQNSSLPDLLPENTTKVKKSRFSLKKLLKRGKDSDTLIINNPSEYNPKAWKNQTFDRSRLSLEIIHPMDMNSDSPPSADSTPTEDKSNIFSNNPSGKHKGRGSTPRARSLSALPQLVSCISDIGELRQSDLYGDSTPSLDRTQLDMTRKAGTVAERSKKYKAPRRTPSFSELRSSSSTPTSGNGCAPPYQRPPKPPPPPRGKSLQPPEPPSVPAPTKPHHLSSNRTLQMNAQETKDGSTRQTSVASETRSTRTYSDSDYANLGDIRLHITPKKPQRPSAVSFARDTLEMDAAEVTSQSSVLREEEEDTTNSLTPTNHHQEQDDNTYESLEAHDEEDHYTYLDEIQAKNGIGIKETSVNGAKRNSSLKQGTQNGEKPPRRIGETQLQTMMNGYQQQQRPAINMGLKKPWMDLQASYAAIAAANYESLAELITTAISEGLENLQKSAACMKWSDFNLEPEEPIQILEDKIVYNAAHKNDPKTKVTLMVTTQKQHSQHGRNPPRPPILATFSDYLPRKCLNSDTKNHSYSDTTKAIIYVLQRAKATTVSQFAQSSASFQANQHVHLRNACFVLLQLIHTLKSLQAEGIEEIDYDLGHILLLHTDVDKPPILVLLPGDKVYLTMADFYKADVATRKTTLCQTTLQLLFHLLQIRNVSDLNTCVVNGEQLAAPVAHTFGVIAKILSEEKASSLTQAKGLLEYMLWGPVDIRMTNAEDDIDVILQRWLDLQRAQMVKSIVSNLHLKISSHTGFHVYEEYQLIFLLQATVKTLKDIISKL